MVCVRKTQVMNMLVVRIIMFFDLRGVNRFEFFNVSGDLRLGDCEIRRLGDYEGNGDIG